MGCIKKETIYGLLVGHFFASGFHVFVLVLACSFFMISKIHASVLILNLHRLQQRQSIQQ